MNKLKPCPFCGGQPELVHLCMGLQDEWYVVCHECEIRTLAFFTPTKAASRWNRRVKNNG